MENNYNENVWDICKFDFREPPTECPYCGNKVVYTSNAEIYGGKQYGNGYCYLCRNCGASVGIHDTKRKKPLGRLATKELKKLKMECHSNFDYLWKKAGFKRQDCYGYLADKLGLRFRETHFGWFDEEYLKKSLEILKNTKYKDIHNYIKRRKQSEKYN